MPRTLFKYGKHQFFNNRGGLNTKSGAMNFPLEETPDILNVDLTKTGAIKSSKGWQHYSSAALGGGAKITGLFRLVKKSGASYLIAAEDTSIWEESPTGTFTTERLSTAQAGYLWSAVPYNDNLYLCNGYDPVKIYKGGAAITNLGSEAGASIPTAWSGINQPSGMILTSAARSERIAAWGVANNPSTVWFSAIQDPLDWTTTDNAFNILVLKENGEPITAVVPLYDLTVVFKKTQAAVYTGDSVDTVILQQVYPVGCVAPRSIVTVGRDLYFWSQQGPTVSSGIQQYGDIAPQHIGLKIEEQLRKVNWDAIEQVVGVHDKENDRVIWFYPPTGSSQNTSALIWHYDVQAWSLLDGVNAHSAMVYDQVSGTTRILTGDYSGFVNEFGTGYNQNSSAYTQRYITPWYDFGDFGTRKRVLETQFAIGTDGYGVNVYYQWDFEADWYLLGRLSDLVPGGSAVWGAVTWGNFTWGAGQTGTIRIHPQGSGKAFRLKFENATVNTSFDILGWSIVVSPKGRR